MQSIIAFDLGSNTLRILEFNGTKIKEFEKVVTTAQDLTKNGFICEEAKSRVFNALDEARVMFDFNLPTSCVTTQALRLASNKEEFLLEIKKRFGLDFRVISGEEEAKLTQIGVEFGMKNAGVMSKNYTLFDLGGGSTEFICKQNSKSVSKSFNLGIVTLSEVKDFKSHMLGIENEIKQWLQQNYKHSQIIATAGTPTTVASFKLGLKYNEYDPLKINGTTLTCRDFESALESIEKLPLNKQEEWVGKGRAKLIQVGIKIVIRVLKLLEKDELLVIDDGLREGVAITFCNTFVKN